jgi:hypothetical protein
MSQPNRSKHNHCRFGRIILNAWLPAAKAPDGVLRLGHLSHRHQTEVGPFPERMRTQDIGMVVA